jgi:hypothetical protein
MVNNINNLLGVMLSADISGQQLLKELMFVLLVIQSCTYPLLMGLLFQKCVSVKVA